MRLACVCVAGLHLELETGLSPVETDTDSHRPLMSDEEEDEQEVETYSQRCRADQPPEEPVDEPPHAIGFFQAFCLPGVLLVSLI